MKHTESRVRVRAGGITLERYSNRELCPESIAPLLQAVFWIEVHGFSAVLRTRNEGRRPVTEEAGTECRQRSDDILVKVDGVSKKFCKSLRRSLWYGVQDTMAEFSGRSRQESLRKNEFWAVKDVAFELRRGECLGLIGRNGAGKSTLLKMLNGLIKPDQGRIEMNGRISALIELGAGFNPILTGRENIYNKGAILGLSQREIKSRFDAIVDFAEIGEFLDMPVQNYSSGMRVRLGFAVSAQIDPDVLIIDEVLAVGDMGFQMKCLNRIAELMRNTAVIFVTHAMPFVAWICNQVIVMRQGSGLLKTHDVPKGIDAYLHEFLAPGLQVLVSGKARIENLRLNPANDSLRSDDGIVVDSGSPLTLQMDVWLARGIQAANVRLEVWNQQLRPVGGSCSREESGVVIENNSDSPRFRVQLAMPNLRLNMGRHAFAIAIEDAATNEILCRIQNAAPFLVRTSYASWADFRLEGTWTVEANPVRLID